MTGSGGSGPPRPDGVEWLRQPLTPAAPPRPYPDGPVPPRRALVWRGSGHGKGWQWALGAVTVASVVWAVSSLGGPAAERVDAMPDLRGYHHVDNLCAITDTVPYQRAGFALSPTGPDGLKYPLHQTLLHPNVDTMTCTIRLIPPGADRADDSTVKVRAVVHKRTDPGPEFTARYETWTQAPTAAKDEVTRISGLGDETYLISRRTGRQSQPSGVTLAVRDGWTTYEISWQRLVSGTITATNRPPSAAAVVDLLKSTAGTTMALLRA